MNVSITDKHSSPPPLMAPAPLTPRETKHLANIRECYPGPPWFLRAPISSLEELRHDEVTERLSRVKSIVLIKEYDVYSNHWLIESTGFINYIVEMLGTQVDSCFCFFYRILKQFVQKDYTLYTILL